MKRKKEKRRCQLKREIEKREIVREEPLTRGKGGGEEREKGVNDFNPQR